MMRIGHTSFRGKRFSLAVVSVALLYCVFSAQVVAEPWWPAYEIEKAGSYCGGLKSTARNSRNGPISVEVKGSGLRLRLDSKRDLYHPGHIAYMRVENIGSVRVSTPPEYMIERSLMGGGWKRVGPTGLGWPRSPAPFLTSGRARCFDFRIPRNALIGQYKVRTWVEYFSADERMIRSVERKFRVT